MPDAFARAIEEGLRRALPGGLPGAGETAVVADAADRARLVRALDRLLALLPRAGVPRGRVTVLLAADAGGRALPASTGLALRATLGVPVMTHDPERSTCFVPGRIDGVAVELSDELREAEAVLAIGPLGGDADARALHALVVPGLVSRATREMLARSPELLLDARRLVPVDLALGWSAGPGESWRVATATMGRVP